ATTNSLNLVNVQPSQAGDYRVIVANSSGSVTSAPAHLTVLVQPPVITVQPTNEIAPVGSTVTFAVSAVGTLPLNYQWRFKGAEVAGATSSLLVLQNIQTNQAGNYVVVITNLGGRATSDVANLIITPKVLVSAWGNDDFGQTDVPIVLTNAIGI